MSEEYTVTEADLVHYWACHMDWRYEDAASEARRAIARIKAEALREAADSHEIKDNRPWVEWWLTDRANRIEKETT